MDPVALLQQVQQCWCDALAVSPGGAPATCCLSSSEPILASCCSGVGWVRMLAMEPVYANGRPSRCVHPTWRMYVELGIARCAPAVCGDGLQNICCDNEASAVNVLMGDFAAFTRALGCCLTARPEDPYADYVSPDQVQIGSFVVDEPEGGCVTARGTAKIQLALNCDCT